jgi:protein transport protein SEC24
VSEYYHTRVFLLRVDNFSIFSLDCDKSVAVEIKHDDKLPPEENVYVQVALLYTSCGGQRRLRVINLALKTCTQLADLFRSCDLDTLILFLAKQVGKKN